MRRTMLYVPVGLYRRIDRVARRERISVSGFLRSATSQQPGSSRTAQGKQPFETLRGILKPYRHQPHRVTDLSLNVDEYLYGSKSKYARMEREYSLKNRAQKHSTSGMDVLAALDRLQPKLSKKVPRDLTQRIDEFTYQS